MDGKTFYQIRLKTKVSYREIHEIIINSLEELKTKKAKNKIA